MGGLLDFGQGECDETGGAGQNVDVRVRRSPEDGIGGAEEEEAGDAGSGGEVADAGVVAEEEAAAGEAIKEVGEREVVPGLAGEREDFGGLGFAADDVRREVVFTDEPVGEFAPARERPVFARGAAAGVDGNQAGIGAMSDEGIVN